MKSAASRARDTDQRERERCPPPPLFSAIYGRTAFYNYKWVMSAWRRERERERERERKRERERDRAT